MPPPIGVSDEQWAGFIANRKQLRKPLIDHAYKLLIGKLAKLAEDGWPPGDMIDRAVEHGWNTVWAPTENRNDKSISNRTSGRKSGWGPRPGMEGVEPASLDD